MVSGYELQRCLIAGADPKKIIFSGVGKTEKEIYSFLSDKYGDWILYKPKLNLGNFLLWGLPYLALIIGGVIIVFLIRKSSKKA